MVNLITCDSYFELFPTLAEILKNSADELNKRRLIFCEAKISLMVERYLCAATGGSFSTDVYSFGKYLAKKNPIEKVLTKEGSAMAIKRILSEVPLKCLKSSRANLASSLYDLIIQLKSAKILPSDIRKGAESAGKTMLENKLCDIATVFEEYERFLSEAGADDQSSVLSYLPEVIERDDEIKGADVFIVGYSGFTAQARAGIESLIQNAKSFTAILTEGDNSQAFVNETAGFIRETCKKNNQPFIEKRKKSEYTRAGDKIVNTLFTPVIDGTAKDDGDGKVYAAVVKNPYTEAERVAAIIKEKVLSGECRYRDFTVAIPEDSVYGDLISQAFDTLDIPYFLDEKKKPTGHPLVTLVLAYVDCFRKNFERKTLSSFYKNPLFCDDKEFADAFENYCIKFNVNFSGIKQPFTFEKNNKNFARFESFRQQIVSVFETFDVFNLLEKIDAKEKIDAFTDKLNAVGERETGAENAQIYSAVVGILVEMQTYLGGIDLPLSEYKNVFLSGINALELAIIPQYNDAVFVGGYKQTALSKAGYLFAVGLTDAVPSIRQDVALLSDGDIDTLEQIKVKVEPKIKVVNHRTRECVALAMGAFSDGLFISFPLAGIDGKENARSEIFTTVIKLFNTKDFPPLENYLTERQGKKSFARDIGLFADGKIDDVDNAAAYYKTVGEEKLARLLDCANKDVKTRLDNREIEFGETSPTTIEEYFNCPYRTFLSKTLGLERRKEGELDALSVGVLMHEIFKKYTARMGEVTDEESSDALFNAVKEEIMQKEEYVRFFSDDVQSASAARVLEECRKYCFATFESFKNSLFKISKTEARFGGDEKKSTYPAISLNGGKIRLKGTIDRVDESDKYFRVLDYKTGDTNGKDDGLFYGQKLQLYLYTAAVKETLKNKEPAGLYYLPVSDKYDVEKNKNVPLAIGNTLGEEDAVFAHDTELKNNKKSVFLPVKYSEKQDKYTNVLSPEMMADYVDYAMKVSELAAERLCAGVIVPSPMEDACKYCAFKAMCDSSFAHQRKKKVVDGQTISEAIKGGKDNGGIDG